MRRLCIKYGQSNWTLKCHLDNSYLDILDILEIQEHNEEMKKYLEDCFLKEKI